MDVRTFYTDDAGEQKPGKGICVPLSAAKEIADLIQAAADEASA